MVDAPELFSLFLESSRTKNEAIRNYLNSLLVINHLRKSGIIAINKDVFEDIRIILANYQVLIKYYNSTRAYMITWIKNSYDPIIPKFRDLSSSDPNFHLKTGELLGYMTPINIIKNNPTLSSDISLTAIFEGDMYKIQLVPQKIVGKTVEEIRDYYKPMIDFLKTIHIHNLVLDDIEFNLKEMSGGSSKRFTRKRSIKHLR